MRINDLEKELELESEKMHWMALLRVDGVSICMSSVDMLTRLAIRRYANFTLFTALGYRSDEGWKR